MNVQFTASKYKNTSLLSVNNAEREPKIASGRIFEKTGTDSGKKVDHHEKIREIRAWYEKTDGWRTALSRLIHGIPVLGGFIADLSGQPGFERLEHIMFPFTYRGRLDECRKWGIDPTDLREWGRVRREKDRIDSLDNFRRIVGD